MFQPHLVGICTFANGKVFRVDQIKANGTCMVTNINERTRTYARNITNAYKSIKFQARINTQTQNTSGWNDNPYQQSVDYA